MPRIAECGCGAVRIECEGEPVRVSVCHCLACQRRSGSAFTAQARWPEAQVAVSGETRNWVRIGESGKWGRFNFCPKCGSTVFYTIEALPGLVAVPLGAFADPDFAPWPAFSVYEERKHGWVAISGDGVEHFD